MKVLRVGINFGNALLARRETGSDTPTGIAIDLASALGARLQRSVQIVGYSSANVMADAVSSGAWDVAFLASDPARTSEIAFSRPYLEIEATYLVPADSRIEALADVDRPGVRIAVSDRSAYDLFLTRTIRHAELVRAPTVEASARRFGADGLEALAGLRPLLMEVAERMTGATVLDGRFTEVHQSIGVPRGDDVHEVEAFVAHIKTSGLLRRLIESHGVRGVMISEL